MVIALGKEIYSRYQLYKKISQLEKEIEKLERENQSLSNFLDQLNSPEWLEKDARLKFNLVKEGEKVIIIHQPEKENSLDTTPERSQKAEKVSNPEKWWRFFFVK